MIIGAGIIGLSIAKTLRQKYPNASIGILESESQAGLHSSGRNSGVLHAGFYYSADSLKAKFCQQGNQALKQYCQKHQLQLNENKKVVVASREEEIIGIDELEKRGKVNGIDVSIIDEKELSEIEPHARTFQKALYSPATATVNPLQIVQHLQQNLANQNIDFFWNNGFQTRLDDHTVLTQRGERFTHQTLINCAGLYADQIAKTYGFSQNYTIIPFKGIYLKYTGENQPLRTNIYPVPNLKNPFLGVHFTVTADGITKIGPTAIPAFWRRNYQGMESFSFSEMLHILGYESKLFLHNAFGFRSLAFEELRKYNQNHLLKLASSLVHDIDLKGFNTWSQPGIRAQLLNTQTLELVQDFIVEGNQNSVHVLNAVSPAFTCSLPFAKWVVENYITSQNH